MMKVIFEEYGEGIIGAVILAILLPVIFGVFQFEIPEVFLHVYEVLFGGYV